MREVQIVISCDGCRMGGELPMGLTEDDALAVTYAGPTRSLDLCDVCRKVYLGPIAALLDEHGRGTGAAPSLPARPARFEHPPAASRAASSPPMPAPALASGKWTCPLCAMEVLSGSAILHVYSKHRDDERSTSMTCAECGRTFASTAGCGSHRKKSHGHDALAAALDGAR